MLFVSPRFSSKISRFLFDSDGRVFSALVILASRSFNVVNVYAPNTVSKRKTFFENLHNYFISQGDLIVASDFNCVDNVLDRLHFADSSSPDKKHLHALLSDFSLIDFWRKKNPLPGAPAPLSPISQYADDTSLIVCSDDSIVASFETYARFEKGSGAKLNQSKSKGLWLGSWSGRLVPPVALTGHRLRSRCLVYLLVPVILRSTTGLPGLLRWRTFSLPGNNDLCPTGVELWSLMLWLYPGFGMWLP